ncbi:MAG: hypothetical protein JWQ40_4821 [Segetibacter sp.]|jgi:hypothetical protein|nr:hypothetical protein [Segetibacter sp.]
MENSIHKGTEFKNVIETWDQNEKKKEEGSLAGTEGNTTDEAPAVNELDQLIKQEATEYDNENKENRILSGERATINDDGREGVAGQ